MNRLNRTLLATASMHAVQGFAPEGKRPRAAHSYRNARRNLARALRSHVPGLTWPEAKTAAQQATYQSLRQAPKNVEADKVVRTVDGDGNVDLAPKSEVEGAPEPIEAPPGPTMEVLELVQATKAANRARKAEPDAPSIEKPKADVEVTVGVDLAEPAPKPKAGALTDADLQAAVNLRADHPSTSAAAKAAGLSRNAFENRLKRAAERGIEAPLAAPEPEAEPAPPVEAPVPAPEKPKRQPKRVVLK